MKNKILYPNLQELNNQEDLSYFISLQEKKKPGDDTFTQKKWNKRADFWQKERVQKRRGDERVVRTLSFLEQRGILKENMDVVDIGCGPGRFAAAFARRCHHVTGLDISEKMIEYGKAYINEEQLSNVDLRICDFQALDIDKEGYREKFDLVFTSMTPALNGVDNLMKAISMSRKWCCHITHLSGRNLLREQIMQEVFGKKPVAQWTGKGFYCLFNLLFLFGYHPETSYDERNQELWIEPDEEYADFIMEHMLSPEEITKENKQKILKWLWARKNEQGLVKEITISTYGRILWNVNNRTKRPSYHENQVRHVFLTGPKQIGKSTVIKRFLAGFLGKTGGFYTIKTNEYLKDKDSVHMFMAGEKKIPTQENLLFLCRQENPLINEHFNRLGISALLKSSKADLILMDELGPHESHAEAFHKKVLEILDGDIPVLGVLQSPAEDFWPELLDRPDVKILEISEENRDNPELIHIIRSICCS